MKKKLKKKKEVIVSSPGPKYRNICEWRIKDIMAFVIHNIKFGESAEGWTSNELFDEMTMTYGNAGATSCRSSFSSVLGVLKTNNVVKVVGKEGRSYYYQKDDYGVYKKDQRDLLRIIANGSVKFHKKAHAKSVYDQVIDTAEESFSTEDLYPAYVEMASAQGAPPVYRSTFMGAMSKSLKSRKDVVKTGERIRSKKGTWIDLYKKTSPKKVVSSPKAMVSGKLPQISMYKETLEKHVGEEFSIADLYKTYMNICNEFSVPPTPFNTFYQGLHYYVGKFIKRTNNYGYYQRINFEGMPNAVVKNPETLIKALAEVIKDTENKLSAKTAKKSEKKMYSSRDIKMVKDWLGLSHDATAILEEKLSAMK